MNPRVSTEAAFIDLISGRRVGVGANLMRAALAAGESIYGAAIRLRNVAFDRGWKASHAIGVPVISVGNLTTGGTGKTPIVAAVASELGRGGVRPGIASRGYRSLDERGNDEKRVLDVLCKGTPHVQDRDRVAAAKRLVESAHCNAIVLDDGFQHLRLARDLDIVLIDATNPWGYGRLLPRGLLREPVSSLRRAGLIVVTRADQAILEEITSIDAMVRQQTDCPMVVTRFAATGLLRSDFIREPLDLATGRRAAAFCGIGNPAAFQQTIRSLNAQLDNDAVIAFPDHHAYARQDVERVFELARQRAAEVVLCTLKDLVKLPHDLPAGPPIFAIDIGVEFLSGRVAWDTGLAAVAEASAVRRSTSG